MKPLSDDSALEEYLLGGSELSRAYAALGDEQPAARVDEAIIRAAREAAGSPSSAAAQATGPAATRRTGVMRWYVPLSAAAIVLLSFGLVLRLTTDPSGQASRDAVIDIGQPVPDASPRRLPAEVRGEKARAFEAAGSAKVTGGEADVAGAADCAQAERTAASGPGDDPARRLQLIRCLAAAGDEAAARREIARLKAEFPQQSIPAELREQAGLDTE